ncbi:WhiB family transcriptional regulator [Nonomuraea fuscirosea]|uniref:WhiB family transcriptional regulator n=1 Tax=Nonomuraea fuscirosea TaxID=1291556 RepID=UPI003722A8F7
MSDTKPQAACASADPELFFPIGESGPALLQIEHAKAICNGCPIRERCLRDHLNEAHGVFGGTTPEQRRRLRAGRSTADPSAFQSWTPA